MPTLLVFPILVSVVMTSEDARGVSALCTFYELIIPVSFMLRTLACFLMFDRCEYLTSTLTLVAFPLHKYDELDHIPTSLDVIIIIIYNNKASFAIFNMQVHFILNRNMFCR